MGLLRNYNANTVVNEDKLWARFVGGGVHYCIVVGSRRLMPPDALQPKAYCTNPGL